LPQNDVHGGASLRDANIPERETALRVVVRTVCEEYETLEEARRGSLGNAFLIVCGGERRATTDIRMENAIDLESLSMEFRFVELGRWVAELVP
jgi:hypothetical protein